MGDNGSNKRPAETSVDELKEQTEAAAPEEAEVVVKTEDSEGAAVGAAADVEAASDPNGTSQPDSESQPPSDPVTIEYLTFSSGKECHQYYLRLLKDLRKNQNLNEYEFNMVMGLLKKGHHDVPAKIGPGVTAIQVRDQTYEDGSSSCFILMRSDGTEDDFSIRKCVVALFPGFTPIRSGMRSPNGGRGSGGRGPGGRGRGRGFRGRKAGRFGGGRRGS